MSVNLPKAIVLLQNKLVARSLNDKSLAIKIFSTSYDWICAHRHAKYLQNYDRKQKKVYYKEVTTVWHIHSKSFFAYLLKTEVSYKSELSIQFTLTL